MKLQHIFKDLLAEDFKSQAKRYIGQGIEPNIVNSYIEKFKYIRDKNFKEIFDEKLDIPVPPKRRNDIDAYTDFHDLESVVDFVAGRRQGISNFSGPSKDEVIDVEGKPVYKDDNVEVWYADSPRACITYKGKFPYSWCVARSDSSNMFYTYRFKPYEPAFYFVKNIKAAEKEFGIWNMTKNVFKGQFKNPFHFFVIQVPKNAKMDDHETAQFIVTSANNDGDTQMSWTDILKKIPKLAPARDVFQPKPFTPEEREKNERFKNGINDREFSKLSYEDKRSYLDIYPTIAKPITYGQLIELPDDLLNLYVSFGIGLDDKSFEFIKPKKDILKRYIQISKRKLEEYLKRTGWERKRLRMVFTELIVLSDEEIKQYLESLDQKEINQFVHDFGEDKFDFLVKHLPNKFTQEHQSLRQILSEANNGSEEALAKIQTMVPERVDITFNNGYINIDTFNYGRDYLEKHIDRDVKEILDKLDDNSWYGYSGSDYFDGYDEGLQREYDSLIEEVIQKNTNLAQTFKTYGLIWDIETIKDLLDTYKKKEDIESSIRSAFSNAKEEAEEGEWRDVKSKYNAIMFLDDSEANIKLRPFVMFISNGNDFFTTDAEKFMDNLINVVDKIYEGYDVPHSVDSLYEHIDNAGSNFNIDNSRLINEVEDGIEEAIDELGGDDTEPDADTEEKTTNTFKLKQQIIQLLDSTLKALGQDEKATMIENDLVKIDIDRTKFHLDGKVYIKLTDKKHNKTHEGYVFIKDIPSYFQNYKLFEQVSRMKKLMTY